MPRLTARTQASIVAVIDDDVAAFGSGAMVPFDRQIADDDAAADAGAEREQHQAFELAAAADPKLAVGRGVRIVGKRYRQAATIAEPVANRIVHPARQVWRIEQHARGDVHRAGAAKARAR